MGECMLCCGKTSFMGICKECGLKNEDSKLNDGEYDFVFKDKTLSLHAKSDMPIKEFCKKNKEEINDKLKEHEMNSVGYFKGKMCPFTQVNIGGTKNIGAAVLWGAPTYDELTWTHSECLKEYCAIWDNKNKQCSIKTIASKTK